MASMDPDRENCNPSSCMELLAADEELPEEERLPLDDLTNGRQPFTYCWTNDKEAHIIWKETLSAFTKMEALTESSLIKDNLLDANDGDWKRRSFAFLVKIYIAY
ncbi:hypothetical protein CAPTEDRAFT_213672 [Capitella teleta]|uniref:Uncharacterized protein n=1 Tax=Capitella teleta TaxID=283909 RepID=R7V8R5_CAPTE|nr:hypothetical protein CAPTEDRAFT_213672 [Capitella teleta]|eukprot:ELU14907.1 hypothetical protein CAPTEDRAFT_213672 [Capitella teleta]